MIITGGTGNGFAAGVTEENRLQSDCITQTQESHANAHEGAAYHALFDQSATAGDDCIFYMFNNDSTDILVEGIWLSASAACEVYIKLGDTGTRNGATAITPTNCNAASGNTADGTFEQGVDLDGGAATLTGGTEVERYVFRAANNSTYFNFVQDIVIPKNQSLTIWNSSATPTVNGTVVFFFHA
jgi:hypothetical protein